MDVLEIKKNFLFLNGKRLPTSIAEFVGKVEENNIEYMILDLHEINDYCIEKSYKKLRGIPKLKKVKIIKPIPNLFMEVQKNSIVSLSVVIAKNKEIISDVSIITKEKLFSIKVL